MGHMQPTNNAVRRDAAPLACSGAFCHGLPGQEARARRPWRFERCRGGAGAAAAAAGCG